MTHFHSSQNGRIPYPAQATQEEATTSKTSGHQFDLSIEIPHSARTLKQFLHHFVSQVREVSVDGALKVSKEALKLDTWKKLGFGAEMTLDMSMRMAAEELVVNSIYYGILQLSPESKVAILQPTADTTKAERKAAYRELFEKLRDPELAKRSAKFSVRLVGDNIQVTIVDTGKFPRFLEVLEQERRQRDDPVANASALHGRGLIIACTMFDRHEQDPETGAITLTISPQGVQRRQEEAQREIEAERALKAAKA